MIYHLNAITVEYYISISNEPGPRIELHKTVKYDNLVKIYKQSNFSPLKKSLYSVVLVTRWPDVDNSNS